MGLISEVSVGTALPVETPQDAKQHSESSRKHSSRMTCTSCAKPTLRRLPRKGFWQNQILPRFGYYPWECSLCRKMTYLRNRGKRRHRSDA